MRASPPDPVTQLAQLPSVYFDFMMARAGSVDAAGGRVGADPTKLLHG
jgi:hypothetical protein